MSKLGRSILVSCWVALVGCGPEAVSEVDSSEDTASQPAELNPSGGPRFPICPQVLPPPCEGGSLYPIYENGCLVGFDCRYP